jgi:hypothetical protein
MGGMRAHLKISHHQYSGQLRPHEHTSYLPLAVLVLAVGVLLATFTIKAQAAPPPPEASSISLSGAVPAPPPKTSATILSPTNNQHFSTTPITVTGTCPKGTLVEIYKSNIFAGSTPCDGSGNFSLQIDLLFGQNSLTAQVYDSLNQAGPVSKPVVVFYDSALAQASPTTFLSFSGAQLLLQTDAAYRGSFPNQSLNVPITVIGGTPPFAINVQWGDSSNEIIARGDNSTFNASHVYKRPGTYKITLQGSDSKHLVAYLSVAAIINGKPDLVASTAANPPSSKLLLLWPLLAIAVTMVVSFWLGERREKRLLAATQNKTPQFGVAPQATP